MIDPTTESIGTHKKPCMLITGAAGFIGGAACRKYRDQFRVIAVDDLSRPTAKVPEGVEFCQMDAGLFVPGLTGIDVVLHLAGQVSVIDSIERPVNDFKRNAELTLKLAMWARHEKVSCFIFSSTNKVYGERPPFPATEQTPLAPQTPYGISKAMAALYVRDLLPESGFVFHQSCIYGENQVGTEDQGWIGFIRRQIAAGEPITCYGDGTQMRDLLHVDDLLSAYDLAIDGKIPPMAMPIGGGVQNAVTFGEALSVLGGKVSRYAPWREHDQRAFASLPERLRFAGWRPTVSARQWLAAHATIKQEASA